MIILNVDDRPDNRYLLETILRAEGHEVFSAADGTEALALLANVRCELIVSDIVMPGMDGFQLCREVKSRPATRDIPFVFFTAVYTEARDEQFALSLGAARFLVKPIEPDQLVAELLRVADQPARPPSQPPTVADEVVFLQEYNRRLVQKLEVKISELEQANARLAESESLFRAVIESTPDLVEVKDLQGRYLHLNAAAARFTGRPVPAVIGRDDREVFGEPTAAAARAEEVRLMRTDSVESSEVQRCLPEDGSLHHFLVVKGPIHDAAGAVNGTFAIARDITVPRRAEEQIRQLSRAVEQCPVTILITDAAGRIEYVNPKFTDLTGYTAAEVVGQNPRLLKSGQNPPELYATLWRTIKEGGEWRGVFVNRKKNGELFSEQAVVSPVKDDAGRITHFIAVKEDITERLRLEAQFRQAQKMEAIGQLAGGVAHDFNNLLTVIQLETSMLAARPGIDRETSVGIHEIGLTAQRAADLTRQLLAFSRRQDKQALVLNPALLIQNLTKLLERILGEDITLEAQCDLGLPLIRADPGMLEQVLMNLAVNSRDAMPTGGRLVIAVTAVEIDAANCRAQPAARPGRHVRLSVTDTGSGIAPEYLPQIFEPFFTTKEPGRGTGLGLATVFGIVKQHDGWIDVESAPGRGTTFRVFLPALDPAIVASQAEKEVLALPRGNETVLVAEDDETVRRMLQIVLERLGYRVFAAASGLEALDVAARHEGPIHLLVTDIVMPGGINGRELAERLGALRPELKAIYISGYTSEVLAQHLNLESTQHLVRKPFAIHTIAQAIRSVLDEVPVPELGGSPSPS